MFRKSMPIALVAIAGCVALVPTGSKTDATSPKSEVSGNPSGTPNNSASGAQSQSPAPTASATSSASASVSASVAPTSSASPSPTPTPAPTPTPSPTPSPTPTPTPTPTPLPNNILKIGFRQVEGVPGLEESSLAYAYVGKNNFYSFYVNIAKSAVGDVYVQSRIPRESIPLLCSTCEGELYSKFDLNFAIFKGTNIKDEFEFVMLGRKQKSIDGNAMTVYGGYSQFDFSYSKFAEIASVSMSPWVVKSVDTAKKELAFDTSVWSENTGNLVLSDVATGDFFGWDSKRDAVSCWNGSSFDPVCVDSNALVGVRQRTTFTGTTAYFIGRGDTYQDQYDKTPATKNTTIFRIHKNGTKEVVGKNIVAYFVNSFQTFLIENFIYSPTDHMFYLVAHQVMEGGESSSALYRVSEDALVP